MIARDDTNTFVFSGKTSIRRSDYNFVVDLQHTTIDNFISDNVDFEIDFWARNRKNRNEESS